MKKITKIFFTALLILCIFVLTVSADFSRQRAYTEGQFTDVTYDAWYASSVKDAYEFGIMQGNSNTTFNPVGTLTVAEGITIAARIHQTINGTTIPETDGEWYEKYVSYAVNNGFLAENYFDNYDREIKRFEIAELLSDVCGDLPVINDIDAIPDVNPVASYAQKALKLYKWGILTGNDSYGTFAPNSNLLRCEISAMAVRIADSTKRVKKTFEKKNVRMYSDAYYIIEATQPNGRNGLAGGWNYDNRFDLFNTEGKDRYIIADVSDEEFMSLVRDFRMESDGLLRLELIADAFSGDNGVYIALENDRAERIVEVTPEDGKWKLSGITEAFSDVTVPNDKITRFAFEMAIDLDNNTASLIINNTVCGIVDIYENASLSRLVLGTNKVGTGTLSMVYVRLSKNYAVNDRFIHGDESTLGQAPVSWTVNGDFKLDTMESQKGYDLASVKAEAKAESRSSAVKTFTPVAGKVAFETMILLPEKTDGASVALTSSGIDAVKFETRDGKIYVGDVMVHDYIPNVWQTLHVEADTYEGKADIIVNGKKRATVSLGVTTFDGIKIEFAPKTDAVMWFDDVELYNIIDHEDYPSYPQVADSDYNIGLNVCWLWRGSGEGWDAVSPFAEFDTYLGFYDEGTREVADWEIKWLTEHGIDFIHACWYCPSSNVKAPIKEMSNSYAALHDGYMMAKYSDLLDFCIMWENSSKNCSSFEQFKEYIWNYWVEYYFTDPRYARLDNKAVLTVWSRNNMVNSFGGVEETNKVIEFMDAELKKLGYDGLILLASSQAPTNEATYTDLKNIGYDATYAYHWNTEGYKSDYQITSNKTSITNASSSGVHHIPTVSVGFNEIGRNEKRHPLITASDHLKVCEDIKTTLSTFNTGTWKDKTLFVSTWNEFSEGTYIFPTESTGFSYLENIRKTFTNDISDHSALDVKPTEAQIERVTHLYPPHHSPVRWYQFEPSDLAAGSVTTSGENFEPVITYDMATAEGTSGWINMFSIDNYSTSDGVISGTGTANDFAIKLKPGTAPFDAENTPIVHIRLKNSEDANFEIFFTTASSPSMDANKYKSTKIQKTGEFVDYYVNMTSVPEWYGKITSVRIDPQTKPGDFEIALIEFMNYKQNNAGVRVNGTDLAFTFNPVKTQDGDYEVVGEAKGMGFYSTLRVYHEWDRFTGNGVLTLKTRDERTLVFAVGSDKVILDGKEQPLGYTFRLRDGLPVFRIKKLCELLGYSYTMDGEMVIVQAATDAEAKALADRKPNEWKFDIAGDSEGWTVQNGSAIAMNGKLTVTPTSGDPAILKDVEIDATEYGKVTLGIVYTEIMEKSTPQLYFTTVASPKYSADKCVNGKYDLAGKKIGDTVEVVFELTGTEGYYGLVNRLRIDPFNGTDTFEIDYVLCHKNESTPSESEEEAAFTTGKVSEVDKSGLVLLADSWEFTEDGNDGGWQSYNVSKPKIADGFWQAEATGSDPSILQNASIDADECQVIVIGVRYNKAMSGKPFPQFYFTTDESPSWSADKGFDGKYVITDSTKVGDTVEVRFDVYKNAFWTGNVNRIRFDPFNMTAPFEIDYIRLYKMSDK